MNTETETKEEKIKWQSEIDYEEFYKKLRYFHTWLFIIVLSPIYGCLLYQIITLLNS